MVMAASHIDERGGPDGQPIHQQVLDQTKDAHKARQAAVGIEFTHAGYDQALAETVPGTDPWGGRKTADAEPTHYLGLPVTLHNAEPWRRPVQLRLVPGGSDEAKAFKRSRSAAAQADTAVIAGYQAHRARSIMEDAATVDMLARVATPAQVAAFVRAWLDTNAPLQPGRELDLRHKLMGAMQSHARNPEGKV